MAPKTGPGSYREWNARRHRYLRAVWRAKGLCVRCGQDRAPGYLSCQICVDRDNRSNSKRKEASLARKMAALATLAVIDG